MREIFIPVLCLVAFVANGGCGPKAHTADRFDNAIIAEQYRQATDACVTEAIRIHVIEENDDAAEAYFEKCMADADKKYGRK